MSQEAPKLSVNGSGSFFRRPERAVVSIQIQHESTDPAEATSIVVGQASSLSAKLKVLNPKTDGVVDTHAAVTFWSSSSINKYSWTPWSEKKEKKPVHRVSQSFEIKFQDFAKLAEIVTEATSSKFTTVQKIDWRLTDETKSKMQTAVRTMAVRDAVQKAKDFAQALGFKDVRIVSLNDNTSEGQTYGFGSAPGGHMMRASKQGNQEQEEVELTPNDVQLASTVYCEFVAV